MSGFLTRIAGIAIRDSALARDATEFVRDAATQMLFDHFTLLSDSERLTDVQALGPEAGDWLRQGNLAIHSEFATMQPVEEVVS